MPAVFLFLLFLLFSEIRSLKRDDGIRGKIIWVLAHKEDDH
jgi:hypothetical protein